MARTCSKCTFENNDESLICEICDHILVLRCNNCTMMNSDIAITCEECKLYLDEKKNKKCKACGRLNKQEEAKCIDCKVSFTCQCNKCKFERKEIKMSDMIITFVQKFTDYADEKKISYDVKKICEIIMAAFRVPISLPPLYLNAYSRIINYIIMDIQEQKNFVKDNFDNKEIEYTDVLSYYQQIIIPYLREYLADNMIDVSAIEEKLVENETLNKKSRPKPVTESVMNKLRQIESTDRKHECFCAIDDIKNIISLPCCEKKVHMSCIVKWFTLKDTCPYCKHKNAGI
jgi:hypothetical protein